MHLREKELQNLGLTDKESKVYLASLELGAAPVQDIARKAGVNRATTYVMIEQLSAKGLMSSVEKGKKRLFLAESPDKLSTRVRLQIAELEEKLGGFKRILPDLHALYDTSGDRPRVRFFEGEDALVGMIEEVHEIIEDGVEIVQIINLDGYKRLFGHLAAHDKHKKKIFETNCHTRMLYVSDKPIDERAAQLNNHPHKEDARRLPADRFVFNGEILVLKNKIFVLTYSGKLHGIIIESSEIAQTVRALFELAWIGSEKIHTGEHRHGLGNK